MHFSALAMTTAAVLAFGGVPLHAQTWQMPPDNQRCPSKWGAGDQRGSANMMKPETVLRAAKLIKTGEVFELAAVLSPDPKEAFINTGRVFNIYTKPALPAANARQANEELVVTELGQIGTQFDAFAHQMWGDSFYNCFKLGEIGTRSGFKKLGVENVGSLMARGVLIDVAGLKGVDMLPTSYNITPDDLQQALAKANQKLEPGDAVVIRTGWSKLMGKENQRYGSVNPGIGIAAAQWLVGQAPMMIAAANCCVEVRPSEPPHNLPVHAMMLLDRESGAGGTGGGARLRIRLHRTAAEDQGRHRVGGGADRHSLRADRLVAAPLHAIERTPTVAVVDARRCRDVI